MGIVPNSFEHAPGVAFDEAMGFFEPLEMGTGISPRNANNQPTANLDELQITCNTEMISALFEDPLCQTSQPVHSFVSSQHHSPTGLPPASFLNAVQDNSFEVNELSTSNNTPLEAFPPAPSDIWLDTSCFVAPASIEQGMDPITALTGEPGNRASGNEGEEFDYVLGGIGGEVPLIQ